jgi:hypothetical protein
MLMGKWSADLAGGPAADCVIGGAFFEKNYELDVICSLADGAFAVEAEVGTYTADGNTLISTPTHASCTLPDRNHDPSSLAYTVTSTTLRLVTPSGAIIFDKIDDDPNSVGGSATIRFGCIEAEGLIRSPIEPL